jgi:prepilin-type N-terminal cleavage/methylation domain-containing protein
MTGKRALFGFTLAELLIALTVLAVIASFTIPKILTQMAEQEMRANFKETFGALSTILREGTLKGTIQNQTNYSSALINQLQYVKYCPIALSGGCKTADQDSSENEAGFIFHNGVNLWGVASNSGVKQDTIFLDLNGFTQPNVIGQDTIQLKVCFSGTVHSTCQNGGGGNYPGQRGAGLIHPENTLSVNRVNELMRP